MQNVAVGIAVVVSVCAAFAIIFAAVFSRDSDAGLARNKAASEQPLPHPLGLLER